MSITHKTERLAVSDVGGGGGAGGVGSVVGSVGSSSGGASPPIPGNATREPIQSRRPFIDNDNRTKVMLKYGLLIIVQHI